MFKKYQLLCVEDYKYKFWEPDYTINISDSPSYDHGQTSAGKI